MGLGEYRYPTLTINGNTAITEKEKAEMIVETFVKIHSSDNISEEGRRRREETLFKYRDLGIDYENVNDALNLPFTVD